MGDSGDTNVRVAVRCRPLSKKELGNGETSIIDITSDKLVITDPSPNGEPHSFGFDLLFDSDSEQTSVWSAIGKPIMDKAFAGFNGTIFAYGQTGSGKTWSMQGLPSDDNLRGIIPRMNLSLFEHIDKCKQISPTTAFLVTVSYFELYNEIIFDLLDGSDRKKRPKGGLEIKEHPALGVYVKGIQEIVVDSTHKLQSIIDKGMSSRTVAATAMNADSSRSHSVFVIKIHQKDDKDELKNIYAKINLVDLAGSERVKSTGAQGATLKEGANINKSLSALGNVINALVEQAKVKDGNRKVFVPYRNSKLTRVLQESLGGNSVTAMLAALSPAACNFDETLSTLKYANRAKAIKVKAIKNEEASQISKLNDEIRQLKEQLADEAARAAASDSAQINSSINNNSSDNGGNIELEARHKQQLKELEDAMKNDWQEKARISEEYENERKRLATEQSIITQKLQEEKRRQWDVIEKSHDPILTLKHVRQLCTSSIDNGNTDASIHSYANSMSNWTAQVDKIISLENECTEQLTVLQIFSESLRKDCNSLSAAASGRLTGSSPLKGSTTMSGKEREYNETEQPNHFNSSSTDAICDKGTISLWKQLRERIKVVENEFIKWAPLQDTLISTLDILKREIYSCVQRCDTGDILEQGHDDISCKIVDTVNGVNNVTCANPSVSDNDIYSTDRHDITRGIRLLLQQVINKINITTKSIQNSREKALDIMWVQERITVLVGSYRDVAYRLEQGRVKESSNDSNHELQHETDIAQLDDLLQAYGDIESQLETLASEAATCDSTVTGVRLLAGGKCTLTGSSGSALGPEEDSGCLNGKSGWISCPTEPSQSYLQFKLPRPAVVKAIHIQGGWGCPASQPIIHHSNRSGQQLSNDNIATLPHSSSNPILSVPLASISPRKAEVLQHRLCSIQLNIPSKENADHHGTLTIETVSGNPIDTANALAQVMEWPKLLKKQDPQKFLKRPPVRFLFDLFLHLANISVRHNGDGNGTEVTWVAWLFPAIIRTTSWEVVSKDKSSKIEFMRNCIHFISCCVGRPENPITTATSIVTGSDVELTNKLLQQTALIVYSFQNKLIYELDTIGQSHFLPTSPIVPSAISENNKRSDRVIDGGVNLMSKSAPLPKHLNDNNNNDILHANAATPIWPTRVRITLSTNGRVWSPIPSDDSTTCSVQESVVNLNNWTDIDIISLDSLSSSGEVKALYVRIQPLQWATEKYDSSEADTYSSPRNDTMIHNESHILPSMRCGLAIQRKVASAQGSSNSNQQFMSSTYISNLLKVFQMAAMAPIKTIEIAIIENDKRKAKVIEDRLNNAKNALEQQYREESEGERALWQTERQSLYDQLRHLEEDKTNLSNEIEINIENNLILSQELTVLQMEHSKGNATLDTMIKRVQVLESDTKRLHDENNLIMNKIEIYNNEKEELQNDIVILTEERDTSRINEEELFERLEDITKDLEELQQSYVDTTERCNDAVDELMDARDIIASLQENRAVVSKPIITIDDNVRDDAVNVATLKQQVQDLQSKLDIITTKYDTSEIQIQELGKYKKENNTLSQQVVVLKEQILDNDRKYKLISEEKMVLIEQLDHIKQEQRIAEVERLIDSKITVHDQDATNTYDSDHRMKSSAMTDDAQIGRNHNIGSPAAESKLDYDTTSPREVHENEVGKYNDHNLEAATGIISHNNIHDSRQVSEVSFASYGEDFDDEDEIRLSRQTTMNADFNDDNVEGAARLVASHSALTTGEEYGDDEFEDDFDD